MQKKIYEATKEIKNKIESGQTTTFKERNYLNVVMKQERKRKSRKLKI